LLTGITCKVDTAFVRHIPAGFGLDAGKWSENLPPSRDCKDDDGRIPLVFDWEGRPEDESEPGYLSNTESLLSTRYGKELVMARTRFCLSAVVAALSIGPVQAQDPLPLVDEQSVRRTLSDYQPPPSLPEEPPTIEPQRVIGVVEGEGPVVITPTQSPLPASQFGGTVRVITSDDIARSNEQTVSQLLRRVPGVDVVQTGPAGGLTTVFLRGAASQHTKVFMDGIPLNDPGNSSRLFDFGNMLLDNVERIEILQGPQSLLYGSDAVGGVVNIITRRGEGPSTASLSVLGGSFSTHRESLGVQGGGEQFHYSVTGSWNQTQGFSAASPRVGGVERDGFEAGAFTGRFGWSPADWLGVEYTFRWIDSRSEIDDASFSLGAPPSDDLLRKNLSENFFQGITVRGDTLDGLISHSVSYFLADYDREDVDDLFPTTFAGQTRKLLYQAEFLLTENNLFTAGADYVAEDGSTDGVFGPSGAGQNDAGVYLQDQLQWGERLFTTVGFRWDDHSAAGRAETYRLTSVYQLWETGTRLRGSIGTSFRAPSLAENLFPFGNPGLRPETSKGWEYGLDQQLWGGLLEVGATYFRNDFRDLILFDLNTFSLENIGVARTHGVEFAGRFDVSECLFLNGSYTVMDTLDAETGQPLVRRPRHKATASATRRLWDDRASLSLFTIFVGDRLDARDGSVALNEYTVLHLTGDYRLMEDTRLFWRVNNLLDRDYEEVTGFAAAPLSFFAGVDLRR
jgi:vitamin B12 transporter